jgi:hypothetical protein
VWCVYGVYEGFVCLCGVCDIYMCVYICDVCVCVVHVYLLHVCVDLCAMCVCVCVCVTDMLFRSKHSTCTYSLHFGQLFLC